ncbi:MAG: DUF4149 domain-containing protein [Thiohalocapsa sp.]
MMNLLPTLTLLAGLALALTWGGMTFFSAVMAPLVFTKLPFETAGAFIREVFPWYYLAMGLTTLLAVLLLLPGVGAGVGWPAALSAFALAGFVMARQVLMPRINQARDAELAGDADAGKRFKRLHGISVWINGAQWLAVFAALWMLLSFQPIGC